MKRAATLILLGTIAAGANAQDKPREYEIGPGDTIRVAVYQNPDLSLEKRVTESGIVSYPLIGEIRLGGLAVSKAEEAMASAFKSGHYIQNPSVSITVVQNRGNQVSVLGHVNHPGRVPLETANIRLSELIAMAGGIAPDGGEQAIVTGMRSGRPFRKEINIVRIFEEGRPESDIVVMGGDSIYVVPMPVVYVYGQVQRPGSYRVERGMTARQALVQGGGTTPRGNEKAIRIFRRDAQNRVQTIDANLNDPILPGDVLHVNESLF
jgi:polysaccharide export outer membrane protein